VSAPIRPFRPDDLPRLREICLRTGAAGGDATGRWSSDDLLPDLFLAPYPAHAPDWAWVADAGAGPVGYLVAVPDTRAFVDWWAREWTPWFATRYPCPERPFSPEEELVDRGFHPEVLLTPVVDSHPAHLHIDLLPQAQGRGLGRALIEGLCARLREAGVPGVHLSIDPANAAAAAFYPRVGFAPTVPGGALFTRSTA